MSLRDNDRERVAYLQGAYDECRRLSTSPRMNRPQRQVIEGEGWRLQQELEALGVEFDPTADGDGGSIPR